MVDHPESPQCYWRVHGVRSADGVLAALIAVESRAGPPQLRRGAAGLDPIDTLVDLRAAHESGDSNAGLDVFTGDVEDTYDAGVVEPAHATEQALASAAEAANLVLKIDDIISAGDLSTDKGDDEEGGAPGGGMGGMGGMVGMGGAM